MVCKRDPGFTNEFCKACMKPRARNYLEAKYFRKRSGTRGNGEMSSNSYFGNKN